MRLPLQSLSDYRELRPGIALLGIQVCLDLLGQLGAGSMQLAVTWNFWLQQASLAELCLLAVLGTATRALVQLEK